MRPDIAIWTFFLFFVVVTRPLTSDQPKIGVLKYVIDKLLDIRSNNLSQYVKELLSIKN